MKITITKIKRQVSKLNDRGYFWYLFGKTETGLSVKSCIYERYGNFGRWQKVLGLAPGSVIEVNVIRGNLIDADSWPVIVSQVENEESIRANNLAAETLINTKAVIDAISPC